MLNTPEWVPRTLGGWGNSFEPYFISGQFADLDLQIWSHGRLELSKRVHRVVLAAVSDELYKLAVTATLSDPETGVVPYMNAVNVESVVGFNTLLDLIYLGEITLSHSWVLKELQKEARRFAVIISVTSDLAPLNPGQQIWQVNTTPYFGHALTVRAKLPHCCGHQLMGQSPIPRETLSIAGAPGEDLFEPEAAGPQEESSDQPPVRPTSAIGEGRPPRASSTSSQTSQAQAREDVRSEPANQSRGRRQRGRGRGRGRRDNPSPATPVEGRLEPDNELLRWARIATSFPRLRSPPPAYSPPSPSANWRLSLLGAPRASPRRAAAPSATVTSSSQRTTPTEPTQIERVIVDGEFPITDVDSQ